MCKQSLVFDIYGNKLIEEYNKSVYTLYADNNGQKIVVNDKSNDVVIYTKDLILESKRIRNLKAVYCE